MSADGLDLDALLAPARWEPGRCLVAQATERLDDDVRPKVEAAATNVLVPAANIVTALRGLLGYAPGETTIKRHRARGCGCP